MDTPPIAISQKSLNTLQHLADESGEPVHVILDRAVEEYRRRLFIDQANRAYAALRQDPEAWAEYQHELALWDCTLMDGLDPNEVWTADGEVYFRGPNKPEDH
jgi:hypothetical protein